MKTEILKYPDEYPITLSEVKAHLRLESDYTDEDDYLESLIIAATDYAEMFMNRKLVTQTHNLILDTFPRIPVIRLPFGVIQSVSDFKYYLSDQTEKNFIGSAWTGGSYAAGDIVTPAVGNGFSYIAISGGTSGESEPIFPEYPLEQIADGEIIWECQNPENFSLDGEEIRLKYQKSYPDVSLRTEKPILITFRCGFFERFPDEWQANTAYKPGKRIMPVTDDGLINQSVVAGTSGESEPLWSKRVGDLTTDNTAKWVCLGKRGVPYNIRRALLVLVAGMYEMREPFIIGNTIENMTHATAAEALLWQWRIFDI